MSAVAARIACRDCRGQIVLAKAGGRWLPFDADPVPEATKDARRHFVIHGRHATSIQLAAALEVRREVMTEDEAIALIRRNWPWHARHMCRTLPHAIGA